MARPNNIPTTIVPTGSIGAVQLDDSWDIKNKDGRTIDYISVYKGEFVLRGTYGRIKLLPEAANSVRIEFEI